MERKTKFKIIILGIVIIILIISIFAWYLIENFNEGLEFNSETVNDAPHPSFVKDAVENTPVFIQFTQNDENCPPCARMRPIIKELIEEYRDEVIFYIININNDEIEKYYKNEEETQTISNSEKDNIFTTYDIDNLGSGHPVTPTFIVVMKDWGETKFAIGYGEFENEDAGETKDKLEKTLDFALKKY